MPEPVRLSKRLIELVGCSRRESEMYIEGGWVTVDGVIVEEPQLQGTRTKGRTVAGRLGHCYRASDLAAAPAGWL